MGLLNNLRIFPKMGMLAVTAVIGVMGVSVLGGVVIHEQSAVLDRLFNRSFAVTEEAGALADSINRIHAGVYKVIVFRSAGASEQTIESETQSLNDALSAVLEEAEQFRNRPAADDAQAEAFAAVAGKIAEYAGSAETFLNLLLAGVDPYDFQLELQSGYDASVARIREFEAFERQQSQVAYQETSAWVTAVFEAFAVTAAVVLIAVCIVAFLIASNIGGAVNRLTRAMQALAGGNGDAEVPGTDRKDEIGAMSRAVEIFKKGMIRNRQLEEEAKASEQRSAVERRNAMLGLASEFEASVKDVVGTVSASATELEATAGSMSFIAEEASRQATAVAAAAEQASSNVQTVAAAAEELTSSIGEITRQVGEAARIARGGVEQANQTNIGIQELDKSAHKIGSVVKIIATIANQVNLLALNATIEAARAGEAGKGFAVVATEVKNLANQAANATKEIAEQIGGVQGEARKAVEAIAGIALTIRQIDEISSAIAAAVEQQGSATREIARNVQQASAGTNDVSGNIVGVTRAAEEAGSASSEVLHSAKQLSHESETLNRVVNDFISKIRAG